MPQIAEQITSLEQELELRIEWLEKGLKEIANGRDDMNGIYIKQQAQSILDGEPTTADEHNTGVIKLDDEYHAKAKINLEKEIAKEWNRDREEKINKESN